MKANVIVVVVGVWGFTLIRCPILIMTRSHPRCVVENEINGMARLPSTRGVNVYGLSSNTIWLDGYPRG